MTDTKNEQCPQPAMNKADDLPGFPTDESFVEWAASWVPDEPPGQRERFAAALRQEMQWRDARRALALISPEQAMLNSAGSGAALGASFGTTLPATVVTHVPGTMLPIKREP